MRIGELYIQSEQHKVLKRDQEVRLTNIEFRILYVLALHQGSILSKEQIYNFVWNGEYLRDDSNITSHIRRLRKKIEDDPTQFYNSMSTELYTLQYYLYQSLQANVSQSLEEAVARGASASSRVSTQTLKMAITVITVFPIMCLYPFISRYFVSGLLVGSVKA